MSAWAEENHAKRVRACRIPADIGTITARMPVRAVTAEQPVSSRRYENVGLYRLLAKKETQRKLSICCCLVTKMQGNIMTYR
jgi:hypothetical protein